MPDPVTLLGSDVQARRPSTHVSLSRVGVTGVEKIIRIRSNGQEQLFFSVSNSPTNWTGKAGQVSAAANAALV